MRLRDSDNNGGNAARIALFRVQSDLSGEFVAMPGIQETASHELHDFLQLREFTWRRLRVDTVEMYRRLGKTLTNEQIR